MTQLQKGHFLAFPVRKVTFAFLRAQKPAQVIRQSFCKTLLQNVSLSKNARNFAIYCK
jgi:hypothetical protein